MIPCLEAGEEWLKEIDSNKMTSEGQTHDNTRIGTLTISLMMVMIGEGGTIGMGGTIGSGEEEDEIGKIQSSGIGEGTNTLTMREIEKVGDT